MILLYIVCLLAGMIVVFIRYSAWRKQYSKVVPSVMPNFFNVLGDFSDLWTFNDVHLNVMNVFVKRSKQFQKQGLVCVWLSYVPLIFLLKADAVKVILKSNKSIDKGWMYEFMKPVVGEGLLTSAGEKWKFQKRLLTPCFHADVVRNFMATFNEESQNLVNILREETKKDFSYISEKVTRCILDIASETIFGVTLGAQKNEDLQYLKSLRKIASIYMSRVWTPWLWPDFLFQRVNAGREMKRSKEVLHQVTKDIIEEKKKRFLKGEKITLKGKRKAMLDLLLEKHLVSQELSEEDIREQVDLFLVAGHETVSTTVAWALFLLGNHPEIQAKVHEEVDRVFGDDHDRPVTEEDFKDLPYVECVLKETLRMYPGIPIFAREASEDMNINGYPIPKGAECLVFVYSLHRDEDVFPDPDKFDPDRFSPENIVNIPEFAYVPFSAGPRNCIGYKFAEMVMRVILSWIMRNFTMESLDPMDKVKPILNIAIHSSTPIRIRISSRSAAKPT